MLRTSHNSLKQSFSLKIKTLKSLTPFFKFRGPNLSAANYQNLRKTPEKIKPTLCYRHYVMDIMLQTLHYDMTLWTTLWTL